MALGGRRTAVSFTLAIISVGSLLSLGVADVKAAENPLTISAHVGYSDVIKAQSWMPVSIVIGNTGPEIDATLEVLSVFTVRPGPGSGASYERPLTVAPGAIKHLIVYLVQEPAGPAVTVRIVKNGRILASQDAASTRNAGTLIGVLSDDSTALDDFGGVHPGPVSADVVHLRLADVPDSALALRAFDLLAVDDFATDGLTAGQQSAIADYVQSGGSLLIGTGATWRRTLAGLPPEILPMKINEVTTLASSPALGGLSGVQIGTGSLTGGAAWLSDGDRPLLVERMIGSGSVTMATFDWKQDPIPAWTGTKPLLRQVLVRTIYGGRSQVTSTQGFGGPMGGPFGGQGGSIYQRSSILSRVLGNLPALDLPSLALTGGLVLVYVLLVGPINFFVLRALRRRALAWVTLPLIAVLVAGGAYGGGLLVKGGGVQTNQVSILHVESGSQRAYQETYTGVLTPTRGDFQAAIGRRLALVSPIGSYNGFGGNGGGDIRVKIEEGAIALPGMTAFTLRGFATERITVAPRISAHLREVNGQLTGSIQNLSSTAFTDAVVIAGDGYQKLGPLAPGATATVGLTPITNAFNGPPAILRIYPNYSFGPPPNQPAESLRDGEAKTEVLTLLQGGNFKGQSSGVILPMVVAWTKQSFLDVTVNGGHPRAHTQTAVVMALPIEQVGAGALPTGIVGGRIVDFVGDTQPGPPGALLVQNGTVTYQFTPPLAAGLKLEGAAISSSSPFGKGPTGPNGPVAALRGEAWDWSTSTWVDIGYQTNTATSLPPATINPATGEVRLRVTVSNAAFLASGLSLLGSVE